MSVKKLVSILLPVLLSTGSLFAQFDIDSAKIYHRYFITSAISSGKNISILDNVGSPVIGISRTIFINIKPGYVYKNKSIIGVEFYTFAYSYNKSPMRNLFLNPYYRRFITLSKFPNNNKFYLEGTVLMCHSFTKYNSKIPFNSGLSISIGDNLFLSEIFALDIYLKYSYFAQKVDLVPIYPKTFTYRYHNINLGIGLSVFIK